MVASVRSPVGEDAQADGILRFMLARGRASRKQVAWLKGYVTRLRERERPVGYLPMGRNHGAGVHLCWWHPPLLFLPKQ